MHRGIKYYWKCVRCTQIVHLQISFIKPVSKYFIFQGCALVLLSIAVASGDQHQHQHQQLGQHQHKQHGLTPFRTFSPSPSALVRSHASAPVSTFIPIRSSSLTSNYASPTLSYPTQTTRYIPSTIKASFTPTQATRYIPTQGNVYPATPVRTYATPAPYFASAPSFTYSSSPARGIPSTYTSATPTPSYTITRTHSTPSHTLTSARAHTAPTYTDNASAYSFNYGVADSYSGANFNHAESNNGYSTSGSYSVALPDGRIQTVNYRVDDETSGYVADVSYSGEARYDVGSSYTPTSSYNAVPIRSAPTPSPSYAPTRSYVAVPTPTPASAYAPTRIVPTRIPVFESESSGYGR